MYILDIPCQDRSFSYYLTLVTQPYILSDRLLV